MKLQVQQVQVTKRCQQVMHKHGLEELDCQHCQATAAETVLTVAVLTLDFELTRLFDKCLGVFFKVRF